MSVRLIRNTHHTHSVRDTHTHFKKEIQSSLHLGPLICTISPPVSLVLGDDKSTGLTRGPGCSSYCTTPGCHRHPRGGNENLIHSWKHTKRYTGGETDMMDRCAGTKREKKNRKRSRQRDTQVDRWTLPSQHKHKETQLHFTFLQALMDEATVLSVLPPSTSTDSEPSNMADDWKLLQGRKGTELT